MNTFSGMLLDGISRKGDETKMPPQGRHAGFLSAFSRGKSTFEPSAGLQTDLREKAEESLKLGKTAKSDSLAESDSCHRVNR